MEPSTKGLSLEGGKRLRQHRARVRAGRGAHDDPRAARLDRQVRVRDGDHHERRAAREPHVPAADDGLHVPQRRVRRHSAAAAEHQVAQPGGVQEGVRRDRHGQVRAAQHKGDPNGTQKVGHYAGDGKPEAGPGALAGAATTSHMVTPVVASSERHDSAA